MSDHPKVSILLPTMNRRDDLLEFVGTLIQQTVPAHELVIVDAGAVPDLDKDLQAALDGSGVALRYTRSEPGTSLQRNIGLGQVVGDFVFLLDDDMMLEPDFIEKMLEAFDLPFDPPVGGVLGTYSSPPRPRGWRQRYFEAFGITHAVEGDHSSMSTSGGVRWLLNPSRPVAVPVAATGRVAYRKEALVGETFDEFLPGYTMAEDVEFSYRIAKKWTLVHTPYARLFHKRAQGGRVNYGDRVGRIIYSRFYFFKKHMDKTPKEVAAFAWTNLGISAFYTGMGLFKAPRGEKAQVLRGVARGYGRCVDDLRGRKVH